MPTRSPSLGVTGLFAASGDLGNFAGFKQGDPDYEREINIVHDATLKAHVALWGPSAWIGRADFNGFQGPGGSESGNLLGPNARLAADFLATEKKALGPLWNTQGKTEGRSLFAGLGHADSSRTI